LTDNSFQLIYPYIDRIWERSGAWPEYVEAMRQGLLGANQGADLNQDSALWASLPGLCCQAAGGDPRWADEVAAAWVLFYAAAQLFDNLEDQDPLESRWPSPGVALNAACGLLFSASLVLNQFASDSKVQSVAAQVGADFYKALLDMASGQHRDLVQPQPTLEEWLETATAKSGAFFGLACQAGARLATDESIRLEGFANFGRHLGTLIQILDDLGDLRAKGLQGEPVFSAAFEKTLPAAYAREVCPEPVKARLLERQEAGVRYPVAAQEALQLLKENGAEIYLLAEIERQQGLARAALEQARPEPAAEEQLKGMLRRLDSFL
jgi:geranylgeranyl diphosphate synthase type I